MVNRFIILISILWVCLFGATRAENVSAGFLYDLNVPLEQHSESTYFAQNDPKKPSDSILIDDAAKPHKDTDKPKTLTPEINVPKKTKPMKPFVPSETIPVDQGVDFPYDI